MRYAAVYSDVDSSSHFRDVEVSFEQLIFAPPAPAVGLSSYLPSSQFVFFKIPVGWFGDWHPAPKRQIFCCLAGQVELTATDGEKHAFAPGDIFLLEDTTGKGHQTRVVGNKDFGALITQLTG